MPAYDASRAFAGYRGFGLCRTMRLRPVAEGVETAEQHQWLRGLEVDEFQGYLFSPALPPARFEALLAFEERVGEEAGEETWVSGAQC